LTAEAASDLQVVLGAAGDLAKKKCLGAAVDTVDTVDFHGFPTRADLKGNMLISTFNL
jgi:hypothetical protein